MEGPLIAKRIFSSNRAADLQALNALLEDQWFDLNGLEWEKSARIAIIPLGQRRIQGGILAVSRAPDSFPKLLRIHHVEHIEIVDTERIGLYELEMVTFDAAKSLLTIKSNFPLKFNI